MGKDRMLFFQQHPHRAPSSWTATASAASITRWWRGWQSCCRSCASTASRWPSAACRYVAATRSPSPASTVPALLARGRVCTGGLSLPHSRESPRVAPASRATAPISRAKQGCGHLLVAPSAHGGGGCSIRVQLRDAGRGQRLQLLRRHTLPWAARRAPSPWQRGTRRLRAPQLQFLCPQDQVLRALLAADLEGFRHFPSWEEAGEASGCPAAAGCSRGCWRAGAQPAGSWIRD